MKYGTCKQVKSCNKHGKPDQSQQELIVALKALITQSLKLKIKYTKERKLWWPKLPNIK